MSRNEVTINRSLPVSLNTWIDETNVVFIVQVGSDFLGDLNESSEGEFVGKVGVKVIFVVLELVHLLDGVVVVSNFWERERVIVKFFGGNSEFWGSTLTGKTCLDLHGVVPVLLIEVSGEFTELVVKLIFGDGKWWWACWGTLLF